MHDTTGLLNPAAPPGKSQRYAKPERERRFLLAGCPPGSVERTTHIVDRYFVGTRLRLRKALETRGTSTETYYQLTQKIPAPEGGPGLLCTTYLNSEEYALLALLPGAVLRKTRYSIPPFGVDEFAAPLKGLFLAEVEFDDAAAMAAFHPPAWIIAEVTFDSRFSGGNLVSMQPEDLAALLASFAVDLATRTERS